MALPKLAYVIPAVLLFNTLFMIMLHSTYQGAVDELAKQKQALEDVQYHVLNNPSIIEKKKEVEKKQAEFIKWWGVTKNESSIPELIVGIPAVPRLQRYLSRTLSAVVEQLPSSNPGVDSPWRDKIQIYIVNNKPEGDFPEFEELKDKYKEVSELHFVDNPYPFVDRYADVPDPDDNNNPHDIPGKRVRHQTYDLISLMKIVEGKSKYFMFMEDDFPFCPKVLDTIYYILRKTQYYNSNWKAIKTSYGMNGIFIRGSELKNLATYFDTNVAHRPPDGLVVEWMCNKFDPLDAVCEFPQRHYTFRWNLFNHIGHVSSLRETGLFRFPGCWASYSHLLWDADGFNDLECDDDDLWPCSGRPSIETLQKNLEMEGWTYYNSYITVAHVDDDIDVSLRFRSMKLIYSGPSSSPFLSPSLFLLLALCFGALFG